MLASWTWAQIVTALKSVINRGTLNWSGSNTTYSVPAGFYSSGTLDSRPSYNNGYNAGVAAGKGSVTSSSVNITFDAVAANGGSTINRDIQIPSGAKSCIINAAMYNSATNTDTTKRTYLLINGSVNADWDSSNAQSLTRLWVKRLSLSGVTSLGIRTQCGDNSKGVAIMLSIIWF